VSDVWVSVEKYLSAGDVRGVFAKTLSDVELLNKMMDGLLVGSSTVINADIEIFWSIGSLFTESYQFGQYASEEFYEISK